METELLSALILKKHKRKHQKDDINIFSHQHQNRRFRKSKRRRHINKCKVMYREKKGELLKKPKQQIQNRMLLI